MAERKPAASFRTGPAWPSSPDGLLSPSPLATSTESTASFVLCLGPHRRGTQWAASSRGRNFTDCGSSAQSSVNVPGGKDHCPDAAATASAGTSGLGARGACCRTGDSDISTNRCGGPWHTAGVAAGCKPPTAANIMLWGAWHAMRSTLASVTAASLPDTRQQPERAQASSSNNNGDGGSSSSSAGWAARSAGSPAASAPPQALFSLARADSPQQPRWGPEGAASAAAGSRAAGGGGGGASGGQLDLARAQAVVSELIGGGGAEGSEEDGAEGGGGGGGAAAAEAALARVECSFCHRRLGRRAASSSSSSRRGSADVMLCDGCHRGFHADCCRYRGLDLGVGVGSRGRGGGEEAEAGQEGSAGGDGAWYHCKGCADCAAGWRSRAAAGPSAAPGGRSWLLLTTDMTPLSSSTTTGQGQGQQQQDQTGAGPVAVARQQQQQQRRREEVLQALQQAATVLSGEYGPRVVDALLDSDFAVLLRDARGTAVTAATLDVYGREVVVMDLAATAEEARGRGHFRALVTSLEGWLAESRTQHWVVALAPGKDGKDMQRMWRQRGFRQLPGRQAREWARQLPGFPEPSGGGGRGSVLMGRRMEREGEGEGEEKRGRVGVVRRAVGGVVSGVAGAVRGLLGYVMLSGR